VCFAANRQSTFTGQSTFTPTLLALRCAQGVRSCCVEPRHLWDRELEAHQHRQTHPTALKQDCRISAHASACACLTTYLMSDLPHLLVPFIDPDDHDDLPRMLFLVQAPLQHLLPLTSSSLPRFFAATHSDFSSTRPPCHIGRMVCINEGGRTYGGRIGDGRG